MSLALGLFSAPFCRTILISSLQKTPIRQQVGEWVEGRRERTGINNQAEDSQGKEL